MNFQPLCYRPDLVFEGRNKSYGAYVLRKIYETRILISVFAAISLFATAMVGQILYDRFIAPNAHQTQEVTLNVQDIDQPEEKKEIPPPVETPPPPPEVPKVETIKFVVPEPVEDKKADDVMVEQKDLDKDAKIGSEDIKGDKDTGIITNDPPPAPPAPVDNGPKEDPNQVYTVVQQQPSFPGGQDAMHKFIRKNFKYPKSAARMGIEGRVHLRFVVRKDGSVGDVTVIKPIANCAECNEEAKRLVSIMPSWAPGMQNGNSVNVYFSLPITFKLEN